MGKVHKQHRPPPTKEYACPRNPRLYQCQICDKPIRSPQQPDKWYPSWQCKGRAHAKCINREQRRNEAAKAAQEALQAEAAVIAAAAPPPARPARNAKAPVPHDVRYPDPPPPAVPTVHLALRSLRAGYAVFISHSATVLRGEKLAVRLGKDTAKAIAEMRSWEGLHGGAAQQAVHDIPAFQPLIARFSHLLRKVVLPKMGYSAARIAQLHLVDFKAIVGEPRKSKRQIIHFDSGQAYDSHPDQISFALHCSEGRGIHTTALANFEAEKVFTATQLHSDRVAAQAYGAYTEKRIAELRDTFIPHLEQEHYTSALARVGDINAFRHLAPHQGTAHTGEPGDTNRMLLFCMLSSDPTPTGQDVNQYYPWHLVAEAYGSGSLEHLESLVQWKRMRSLDNYIDDEVWMKLFKAMRGQRSLFRRYYGKKKAIMLEGASDESLWIMRKGPELERRRPGGEEEVEEEEEEEDDGEEEEQEMEEEKQEMELKEGEDK